MSDKNLMTLRNIVDNFEDFTKPDLYKIKIKAYAIFKLYKTYTPAIILKIYTYIIIIDETYIFFKKKN